MTSTLPTGPTTRATPHAGTRATPHAAPVVPVPVVPVPVVLVGHGSRDQRSARVVRDLAAGVAARWPGAVTAAFLDFDSPPVPAALRELAAGGGSAPVVVPALLTSAHHDVVDLPRLVAASGVAATLTGVLGPDRPGRAPHPLLVAALCRRLREQRLRHDGIVLLAAGSTHASARDAVRTVAATLSAALDVACVVGHVAGARGVASAVAAVRAAGATRVVAASYFLAPGRLHTAAAAAARSAGALGVAEPIGAAPELVELIVRRLAGRQKNLGRLLPVSR